VHFWGVRGSLPAPVAPSRVKSKISAIVEQITPADLTDAESREKFLSGLPPWLFGTAGGNSACVSLDFNVPDECIVFDCGSGIRELGMAHTGENRKISRYHIFLSHFHWDHIHGLPFFGPGYNPSMKLDFYSPAPELEKFLGGQMVSPYFPINFSAMRCAKTFHILEKNISIGGCNINFKRMNHPGGSYAYRVSEGNKRFIYSTDTELTAGDFQETDENAAFFMNADLLVIDCQYTIGEAVNRNNWGHSAFSLAVDFTAKWGIKHMVMFHHDPSSDDFKLYGLLQSAKWYLESKNIKGIELSLAYEGLEITI
jgi:phosphoribosyl 1,2-cyclic phosphodiesterase